MMKVRVRELKPGDIDTIVTYFLGLSAAELAHIGIDGASLKLQDEWRQWFEKNLYQPLDKVSAYFLVWDVDDTMVGFSFIDRIVYGSDAYLHMYLIQPSLRQSGYGQTFIKQTITSLFDQFKFDQLYCEPSAINTSAQRAVQACGFKYIKTHNQHSSAFAYQIPLSQWLLTS
jgi:RimJ/RimL family protein N-acetyltransferase